MDYLGMSSAPASDAITDGLITVNLRWLMKKLIERPKVYIVIHAPPADGIPPTVRGLLSLRRSSSLAP